MSLDDYQLSFEARDGSAASAGQERSGARRVRVLVKREGAASFVEKYDSGERACAAGSCAISGNWNFHTDDYEWGALYTVRIEATDQLGQQSTTDFSVRPGDRVAPQVGSVTSPPGWLKDGVSATSTVSATDSRSGIKSFALAFPGGPADTITRNCGAASQPGCLRSDSAAFSYQVDATRFPAEGRVQVRATVKDAAGNESAAKAGEVRIDRSAPGLSVGGSLYLSKDALLVLDTYQLTFDADDGSTEAPEKERSGARVVVVEVKKEGAGEQFVEKFRTAERACPEGSCAVRGDWTFQTAAYERDKRYTIRTTATDQLGHATVEEFDVYVGKALGQTLPVLADRLGLEDFWQYDSTGTGAGSEAHTNLDTGGLVWRATPVVNPGRGLSTVANLTYNSQESQADALRPENLAGDLLGQYNEVGRGFSLGISGVTRLNEPLDLSQLAAGKVTLTDADGTRHLFESAVGGPDFGEVFTAPPGVQLHLRRWSSGIVDPLTGLGVLSEPAKAYAMTRPDGVTYFFDQFGYATSIRDRNANTIRFRYEYRSPTKLACEVADLALRPPEKVCVRKVVEVIDPAGNDANPAPGRSLAITYKPRRVADLTAGLVPSGGLPAALQGQAYEPSDPEAGLVWSSGPVESIVDHKGRVYEFAYDDNGYLKTFTEARGAQNPDGESEQRSWSFEYEDDPDTSAVFKREPLSAVRDPRSKATTFTYASDSQQEGEENCGTQADDVGEHGDGIVHRRRVKTLTDRGEQGSGRASRLFAYGCAEEGGVQVHRAVVTDARDGVWKHKLDALGKPEEMEDPRGTKTALGWDGDNNPNKITQAAGSPDEAVTSMTYNANGQLLQSTDPNSHATKLTYNPARGMAALSSPRTRILGTASTSIDSERAFVTDLASIEKPKGGTTRFQYDDFGNVTLTTDPRGFQAETVYDARGQVTDEWDQERNHTQYPSERYDPNGFPGRVIDPRGKVWDYAYDQVGNVTSVMDPRHDGTGCGAAGRQKHRTELLYDSYDRLFREFVPKDTSGPACDFVQRDRRYDANGNLTEEIDGNRNTRVRTYTATDQLEEDRSPAAPHADGTTASEVSRREYDREDNLILEVAPRGTRTAGVAEDFATRFTVDEIGRTVASTRRSRGPEPGENVDLTTSYAYDRRDNVVGLADPARNITGDPVENARANRRFSYRYDKANNPIDEVEDPNGDALCTLRRYDANDNLEQVTDPRGTVAGEGPCALAPVDGEDFTTTRDYYPDDQLEHVTDAEGRRISVVRRRDGKVTSLTKPKGTASAAAGDYETKFDYWPTGEIKSRTLPYAEDQYGSRDLKVQYGINDVGDPVTITDARGKTIANDFLDSGQLAATSRASWWALQGGNIQQKGPGQAGGSPGAGKPQTEGQGDFGGVERSPMPGVVPAAGAARFSYDDELRLTATTDAADNTTVLRRDPLGRVSKIERPLDAVREITEEYAYDPNGNRARVTDPEANSTVLAYDQFDRVVSETRPGSPGPETTKTSYFPNGTVDELVTPRGTVYQRDYDALDRLIRQEDPEGNVTRRDYDAAGNPIWERSPRGNREPFPPDHQRSWFDTNRTFNAANELTKQTNGFGHQWRFDYDAHGNQTRVDAPGAARNQGAPEARQITERDYDGLDRLWRESTGSPDNGGDRRRTRVWEYDPNGMLRRAVNPAGVNPATGLPNFAYTQDGQVDDPAAAKHATVHQYNSGVDPSLVSAKRLPWGDRDAGDGIKYRQTFTYEDRGFLTRVDPPHTATANDNGKTTYDHYATGWIKSATDSHKRIDYDYTERGDQKLWTSTKIGETNARRKMTREYWQSGALKQRTGMKPSAGPDEVYRYSYDYNPNRSLTRMHDGRLNRTTDYGYDQADRQVRVDESPFAIGEQARRGKDTVLGYDANGNVTSRRTDGRVTGDVPVVGEGRYVGGKVASFVYDRLDREVSMVVDPAEGADRRTASTWWDSGQRRERWTKRADSANDTVERTFFFTDGRMSRMDRRRDGAPAGTFAKDKDYAYDLNGNRTTDERGTHEYNSRDQLVRWAKPDGGASTTYTLNGSGAVESQTTSASAANPATTTDYVYGPDDERLLRAETTTAGAADAVTTTYSYDPGGLGEIIGQSTEGQAYETTYEYDEFARQKRSDDGQGKTASYTHDGLDRRDTKTENAKTFDFSYIGSSESLSQEQQFGGTEKRSYDYDSGMDRLGMDRQDGAGFRYRAFSKDANGSVEGLEDDSGSVPEEDKYSYDPYGGLADPSGETGGGGGTGGETETGSASGAPDNEPAGEDAQANPFRFEGHYYDSNSKTYDMQARPYLPQAGRFLTEDRYEQAASDLSLEADALTQDRYSFAGGNPVNNIEFDGHEPIGSYQNGCDNTYGSDERCAEEPKKVQKRTKEYQKTSNYNYAYSNNYKAGRRTSPKTDVQNAQSLAWSTPEPPAQATSGPAPDKPNVAERAVGLANDLTVNFEVKDASCFDPRKSCAPLGLFNDDPVEAATSVAGGGIAGRLGKEAVGLCAKKCPGLADNIFSRVGGFADETGSVGGVATKGGDDGVVYLRTDKLGGKPYVGQSKSAARLDARQVEHARDNPFADFEFSILGRAKPGTGLDRLEESFIRGMGGATTKRNPGGALANRRHQMSDRRYQEAGGAP